MGNALPEQNSYSFLLESYNLLGEQNNLKILADKQTDQQFALMEQCFPQRKDYELAFKKLTNRSPQQCENVLQMVKMWSKEHNGICSNVYKIYRVYEYPRVRLSDEIQARQGEQKLFEQVELYSILQSCLNAMGQQEELINLSPQFVFILPEGNLKIAHPDLLDPHHRTNYQEEYYYSPQKIAHFQSQHESPIQLSQEKVFSLAMTLLHSALLTSPSSCYQISLKKFNRKKLAIYLQTLRDLYSPTLCSLLNQMLAFDPSQRCTMEDVQHVVNEYFINNSGIMDSSKLTHHSRQNDNRSQQRSRVHELSLLYSRQTCQRPSQQLELQSNVKRNTYSLELNLQNSKETELPKNHHILQKTKKVKEKQLRDKQNIYTDPKIIELIRSGIKQITRPHDTSHSQFQPKDSQSVLQPANNADRDPFSQYELKTEQKDRCTFMVQTYEDNSHFQGMVQHGLKNGYGRLVYPDGVYYQGNFKNDTLEGKGSLFYGKGRPAYVGDWVDNKFHGIGTLYNQFPTPLSSNFNFRDFNTLGDCWVKYQGEFVEDIKEGWGKIVLTSGQIMEGTFYKGLLHGGCIFHTNRGQKIQGLWNNNVMRQN